MVRRIVKTHVVEAFGFGLGIALAGLMVWWSGLTGRLDLMLYDALHPFLERSEPSDVLIAAIDDSSIRSIGRWPWSRRVHARFLDRLTDAGVGAVGFDILFAEPEISDPAADRLFAEAISRNGKVVLALAPQLEGGDQFPSETLPLSELAVAAAGMGHADFELDRDGICRTVFLWAGPGSAHWPAFALALIEASHGEHTDLVNSNLSRALPPVVSFDSWVREEPMLIPFAGPPGHFVRISYADILHGRVSPDRLKGKLILIGATAAGLGDALVTPVSKAHSRMPGVELNANVLAALKENRSITTLSAGLYGSLVTAVLLMSVLGLIFVPTAYGLGLFAMSGGAVLATSAVLFIEKTLWFPPSPILIALIIGYTLWSWLYLRLISRWAGQLSHRVEHQEQHDLTTGLPNRRFLLERTRQALVSAQRDSACLALLVINVGGAKAVSRRLGWEKRERLFRQTSLRVRALVRGDDLVARVSDAEFAVLMMSIPDPEPAMLLGTRLLEAFRRPFTLNGEEFLVPATIGAGVVPGDGETAEALMENAYSALQVAQEEDGEGIRFFSENIGSEMLARSSLERDLHASLANGELELFYQPQVLSGSGRIAGAEVLLRWNSPRLGRIDPSQFIPLAEHTGFIVPLGAWVLEKACRQNVRWLEDGLGPIRVGVNVSGIQFSQENLVDTVSDVLEATSLPPHLLELELTESALMKDVAAAAATLEELKRMGVSIAVDDFGTGYSSLSYLNRFSLDRVKIDRSFISEIGVSTETEEITLAIIGMAHRLKLKLVAEGVETEQQREFLRVHECDELQGFLFGRPVPAEGLTAFLKAPRAATGLRGTNREG